MRGLEGRRAVRYSRPMRWLWLHSTVLMLFAGPALAQQPGPAEPPPPTDIEDVDAPAPAPAPDQEPEAVTFEQLRARLATGDTGQRKSAAIDLGLLGDRRAVHLLISALRGDRAALVRAAAARALGTLRARKGVAPLRRAASADPDPRVQTSARTALTGMGRSVRAPRAQPPPRKARPRRGTAHSPARAAYQSGRRLRLSGIVILAVGGGLGLLVGALTAAAHGQCMDEYPAAFPDEHKVHCTNSLHAAIVGFSLAGASLGAGVPMWLVGARRMAASRQQKKTALVPGVGLSTDRVVLRWRF